jgi:hypothetical protein
MKRILFVLGLCMPLCLFAQQKIDIDTELIKRRAKEQIAQLNDYLQIMADPHLPLKTRDTCRSKALSLFIANGEEYEVVLSDGDTIRWPAACIENVNKFRRKPVRRLVKDYFTGLINMRFNKVQIQSVEVVTDYDISTLHKVSDNLFICDGWIEKEFVGYRDGSPLFKDISRKKIKSVLSILKTEDGVVVSPKLGDIVATEY